MVIILPVVSVSALTWFIRYIYYWNLQFLNNVIIHKIKVFLSHYLTFQPLEFEPTWLRLFKKRVVETFQFKIYVVYNSSKSNIAPYAKEKISKFRILKFILCDAISFDDYNSFIHTKYANLLLNHASVGIVTETAYTPEKIDLSILSWSPQNYDSNMTVYTDWQNLILLICIYFYM